MFFFTSTHVILNNISWISNVADYFCNQLYVKYFSHPIYRTVKIVDIGFKRVDATYLFNRKFLKFIVAVANSFLYDK